YEEHIGGSPYTYAVAEGPTDPAKCTLDSTQSIKAGEEFRVTITTYDFHGNPTNHADDTFLCTLDNGDAVEVARADDGTVVFSKLVTAPGSHKLTVLHVPTNTKVAGSPISFEVIGDDDTNTYIAVGISAFLLLVGSFFYRRHQLRAAAQLKQAELEMGYQHERFSEQRKEMEQDKQSLEAEKEELEEEVRRKKHSEEELKVMVDALQSVSKERQDELREVMIESKDIKVEKLLGKGGFGVVNLATYRGAKVAVKQLLKVTDENVTRFRHECFLMKNLAHPHVVKLVGVVWDSEMFACALEFVENGSVEDWLRRTAGGKRYIPPVKMVIGKNNKKRKKKVSLAEVTHRGYNYNRKYDESEHTDQDKAMFAEGKELVTSYALDQRTSIVDKKDLVDFSYTTALELVQIPVGVPTLSDREILYRTTVKLEDDGSFTYCGYSIEDERRQVKKGHVRADTFFCQVMRPLPGSKGKKTEVLRLNRIDPKFPKGFGFINKIASSNSLAFNAQPLIDLKRSVETIIRDYNRPGLPEATFRGFDLDSYDPSEISEVDKVKLHEADALLHDWWMSRYNPKMNWKETLKEDGEKLDHDVHGWMKYESGKGMAFAHAYINATPVQTMGYMCDDRNQAKLEAETLEGTYTTALRFMRHPSPLPTISDRESLYRSVTAKDDGDDDGFINVCYTVEDARRPVGKGSVRMSTSFACVVREAPGSHGKRSEVWRLTTFSANFGVGLDVLNSLVAAEASKMIAAPLVSLKWNVEQLLDGYKPPLVEFVPGETELTWKGHLWKMALEAALGVQYLHHHRYWSDGGTRHNGATNEMEEEEAGWKESVIHRDLKPDNMLLTRDWLLKLTDFGEARAENLGATMTSVGTPIYISPEVMRADHYDTRCDSWSYGLCLVAMIRADKNIQEFFYQCLRKQKRKRTTKGLGMGQMTKYYYQDGWRPLLPLSFVKAYPKLHTLIQECWKTKAKHRPTFDEIVTRLQNEIGDEIKRKEEPKITLMSVEPDSVYQERIGKDDEIEDSDEEEEGGKGTRRGDVVSKAQHEKVVAAKDKVLEELTAKMNKVEAEQAAGRKKTRELEAKMRDLEAKELEQGGVVKRWGVALADLKEKHGVVVGSPEDLQALAATHVQVMKELEERREGGGGDGVGGEE
ncbi:hypothetical protein TeGR_g3516, partial [Tetraparma gracilis]